MSASQILIEQFKACHLANGDEKKRIFADMEPNLTTFVRTRTLSKASDLIDDIIQDCRQRVWGSLQTMKSFPDNPLAYLGQIVHFSTASHIEKKAKLRDRETGMFEGFDTPNDVSFDPLEKMIKEQQQQDIVAFLRTLKRDHARICLLHWAHDMKKVDIANELNISESTVNTVVFTSKLSLFYCSFIWISIKPSWCYVFYYCYW